jgi:protein TonB
MFEDSTFESTGRIHTRSRSWMIAAALFNGSILLALILIPLIYPEALSPQAWTYLMTAPPPPPSAPPTQPRQQAHPASGPSIAVLDPLAAPRLIPNTIATNDPGPPSPNGDGFPDPGIGVPGGSLSDVLRPQPTPHVVHQAPSGPVRISELSSSAVIYKVVPVYPAIAKATGVQGTVVLEAIISKQGTIESLRVVSGPAMLQQAARDAVSAWRYRPYLLNGEPVAVETTVNVVFTLGR